ncbi:hypothetical protein DMY01_10700 [Cutibacterium avidum]|uniref:Uncharacterized protein n=1 Tax=Cutibacterium avidum TaxID=33010 RepID=A0A3E2DC96_9ACTN|nr:hypothetical protein CHT91_10610 [Cutibacterium avidum]TMT46830.1 hypothetical protein DMY01_10700 [Cutibacterium avidum]
MRDDSPAAADEEEGLDAGADGLVGHPAGTDHQWAVGMTSTVGAVGWIGRHPAGIADVDHLAIDPPHCGVGPIRCAVHLSDRYGWRHWRQLRIASPGRTDEIACRGDRAQCLD